MDIYTLLSSNAQHAVMHNISKNGRSTEMFRLTFQSLSGFSVCLKYRVQ